jgi:TusA-related sulfurtransferase
VTETGAALLDVRGLMCPEPITELQEFVGGRAPGEVIEVLADDGGIQWDLPAWCISHGHTLIGLDQEDDPERGHPRWRGRVRLGTP